MVRNKIYSNKIRMRCKDRLIYKINLNIWKCMYVFVLGATKIPGHFPGHIIFQDFSRTNRNSRTFPGHGIFQDIFQDVGTLIISFELFWGNWTNMLSITLESSQAKSGLALMFKLRDESNSTPTPPPLASSIHNFWDLFYFSNKNRYKFDLKKEQCFAKN